MGDTIHLIGWGCYSPLFIYTDTILLHEKISARARTVSYLIVFMRVMQGMNGKSHKNFRKRY
jgi:hypothetical protein